MTEIDAIKKFAERIAEKSPHARDVVNEELDKLIKEMTTPNFVKDRISELNALCEKYPIEIPVVEAAKYLHIHPESLRFSIRQGTCGFPALAWKKPGNQNYAFSIQTLPFYLSQTGQKGV